VGSLAIHRHDGLAAADLAMRSRVVFASGPMLADAELVVSVPRDEAIVIGAFQRASEVSGGPIVRRGSGGAAFRVGPGSVWIQLHGRLIDARPDAILNRYVRPLLRALTKSGAHAHYFGRDWVSVAHRPSAAVAFGHAATPARTIFEAVVAARTPFALGARPSFLGKEPAVLDLDPIRIADAIADSYASLATGVVRAPRGEIANSESGVDEEPEWTSRVEEAIGTIAAGLDREGRLRLGGELMASRDAIAALENRVEPLPADEAAIGAAVDETLTAPGVALFGVRSLASIRDVLVAAKRLP
jgi:hypothetical protein